jgi:hypothetical protein
LSASHSFLGTGVGVNGTLGGNQFGDNPLLGTLQLNGGPVLTLAPLDGSPVIGTGFNASSAIGQDYLDYDGDGDKTEPVPIDARGGVRIEGIVDMGAVESHAPVGVDDASLYVREEIRSSRSGNVLDNDTDVDVGDNKTVTGFRSGIESVGAALGAPARLSWASMVL